MKALGRHVVAELSHCNAEILTDLDRVQAAMVQAALVARAEIREVAFHRFYPTGVSGVVVLAESHLAIHTWPDLGYAAIDVYTCGDTADPWRACRYLAEQFGCQHLHTTVMERGVPSVNGRFGHMVEERAGAASARFTPASKDTTDLCGVGVLGGFSAGDELTGSCTSRA